VVHRNGDSGSPRVSGSMSESKFSSTSGLGVALLE
jgi:hypothetical protein